MSCIGSSGTVRLRNFNIFHATPPGTPEPDADVVSIAPSVASSRRPRIRLPAVAHLDLPGESDIIEDNRPDHGPAWRAVLPPGYETQNGIQQN